MKRFTKIEIEFLKENYLIKPYREIAAALKRTESSVKTKIAKMKWHNPKSDMIRIQKELSTKNKKRCNNCQLELEMNSKNFYVVRSKTRKNPYFHPICKLCQKKRSKLRWLVRLESIENYANFIVNSDTDKRKMGMNLCPNDIINQFNIQNGLCFYTGQKLQFKPGLDTTISIDRKNASKFYEKDNIVLCCVTINYMKQSLGVNEFIYWCNCVVKNSLDNSQSPNILSCESIYTSPLNRANKD